jgi:hypothetical protein
VTVTVIDRRSPERSTISIRACKPSSARHVILRAQLLIGTRQIEASGARPVVMRVDDAVGAGWIDCAGRRERRRRGFRSRSCAHVMLCESRALNTLDAFGGLLRGDELFGELIVCCMPVVKMPAMPSAPTLKTPMAKTVSSSEKPA